MINNKFHERTHFGFWYRSSSWIISHLNGRCHNFWCAIIIVRNRSKQLEKRCYGIKSQHGTCRKNLTLFNGKTIILQNFSNADNCRNSCKSIKKKIKTTKLNKQRKHDTSRKRTSMINYTHNQIKKRVC